MKDLSISTAVVGAASNRGLDPQQQTGDDGQRGHQSPTVTELWKNNHRQQPDRTAERDERADRPHPLSRVGIHARDGTDAGQRPAAPPAQTSSGESAMPLPGIALFAGAVVSLLLFLGDLTHPTWWLLAVSIVLTAVLLSWERRTPQPLIDVRMLAANKALHRA